MMWSETRSELSTMLGSLGLGHSLFLHVSIPQTAGIKDGPLLYCAINLGPWISILSSPPQSQRSYLICSKGAWHFVPHLCPLAPCVGVFEPKLFGIQAK
jgi:hypothetical protein